MAKKEPSKISHTFLSWRTLIYSIVAISSWKLVAGDKMQTKTNHHSACSLHCIHFYKIHWTWKKFVKSHPICICIGLLKIEVIENENNDTDIVITRAQRILDPTRYHKSFTEFENQRKSLIQHCERSELRSHLERTKVIQKRQKWSIGRFLENLKHAVKQCYQTGRF